MRMSRPRAALLLLCGFWLVAFASQISAQGRARVSDPCRREDEETACFVAHEEEFLDIYGLAKASDLVAQGTQVRRAMFIDGYGRNTVAVEFRRLPGRDPSVAIYLPRPDTGQGLAAPALEAAVPLSEWEAVGERGGFFDRRLVPDETPSEPGSIRICSHAWVYFVESTDPTERDARKRIRRRVENACAQGLTEDYAIFLTEVAVRLIPACAALDADFHRNAATILNVCGRFTGDRVAAAQAYNSVAELRGGGHGDQLPLLRRLFYGTVLDWNGERIERGVAEAWLARTSGEAPAGYFTVSVHGESARRVRMTGRLERWESPGVGSNAPSVLWRAPVEFVWSLNDVSTFSIERATVGRFERVEGICPPGLLTGAERANNCRW